MAAVPPLPPKTAIMGKKKNFFLPFLAELDNSKTFLRNCKKNFLKFFEILQVSNAKTKEIC